MGRYTCRVPVCRCDGSRQDSPAEKAGLRKDDVILSFNGEAVTSTKTQSPVQESSADQNVHSISRGGSEQEIALRWASANQ